MPSCECTCTKLGMSSACDQTSTAWMPVLLLLALYLLWLPHTDDDSDDEEPPPEGLYN